MKKPLEENKKRHPLKDISGMMGMLVQKAGEPGDLTGTLKSIGLTAQELFSTDICTIFAVNPITERFLLPPTVIGEIRKTNITNIDAPRLDSLARLVLEKGLLFVEDISSQTDFQSDFTRSKNIQSFIAIALQTKEDEKSLAILYLDYRQAHQFSENERFLIEVFREQASFVLQSTWFIRRYREVSRIGQEINQDLKTIENLTEKINKHLTGILDIRHIFTLAIYQPQSNSFNLYTYERNNLSVQRIGNLEEDFNPVIQTLNPFMIHHRGESVNRKPAKLIKLLGTNQKTESMIIVPLRDRNNSLGLLSVQHKQPKFYNKEDLHILQLLSHPVALAINSLRLLDDIRDLDETGQILTQQYDELSRQRAKDFELFHEIDLEITKTLDLETLLQTILEIITKQIPTDDASILLFNPETRMLETKAALGPHAEFRLAHSVPLDQLEGITRWVFENKSPVLVDNVSTDPNWRDKYIPTVEGALSVMDVPLLFEDECIGVINFETPEEAAFTEEDQDFMVVLAGQAMLAIRNAQLYQEVKDANIELEKARKRDKLAAIGEISGDLVHRMNSPLAAIRVNLQFIEEECKDILANNEYLADQIGEIRQITSDAIQMVEAIRDEARANVLEPIDIQLLINETLENMEIPDDITLYIGINDQDNLPKVIANQQLKNVTHNLITNALESMPEGGELRIDARVIEDEWVDVIVEDTGIGIPEEWAGEIFEVFTGKRAGSEHMTRGGRRGQGLGLWYSKAYIEGIGGRMEDPVSGRDGKGTKFTVRLMIFKK